MRLRTASGARRALGTRADRAADARRRQARGRRRWAPRRRVARAHARRESVALPAAPQAADGPVPHGRAMRRARRQHHHRTVALPSPWPCAGCSPDRGSHGRDQAPGGLFPRRRAAPASVAAAHAAAKCFSAAARGARPAAVASARPSTAGRRPAGRCRPARTRVSRRSDTSSLGTRPARWPREWWRPATLLQNAVAWKSVAAGARARALRERELDRAVLHEHEDVVAAADRVALRSGAAAAVAAGATLASTPPRPGHATGPRQTPRCTGSAVRLPRRPPARRRARRASRPNRARGWRKAACALPPPHRTYAQQPKQFDGTGEQPHSGDEHTSTRAAASRPPAAEPRTARRRRRPPRPRAARLAEAAPARSVCAPSTRGRAPPSPPPPRGRPRARIRGVATYSWVMRTSPLRRT